MAGTKRKDSPTSSSTFGPAHKKKSRSSGSHEPRVDATYGQRNALPGLDAENGEAVDYIIEDEDLGRDALAYLRSVRHEASAIPNLLVAESEPFRPPRRDECSATYRVRYADGAYYSTRHAPSPPSEDGQIMNTMLEDGAQLNGNDNDVEDDASSYFDDPHEEDSMPSPMSGGLADYYDDMIILKYHVLRDRLATQPPAQAIHALESTSPPRLTDLSQMTPAACRSWRWQLQNTVPVPAQIAMMSKTTVLRLLSLLLTGNLIRKGKPIGRVTSAWIWALLAKAPERGLLNSEEVGGLRDLGKAAVAANVDMEWMPDDEERPQGRSDLDERMMQDAEPDAQPYLDKGDEMQEGELLAGLSTAEASNDPDEHDTHLPHEAEAIIDKTEGPPAGSTSVAAENDDAMILAKTHLLQRLNVDMLQRASCEAEDNPLDHNMGDDGAEDTAAAGSAAAEAIPTAAAAADSADSSAATALGHNTKATLDMVITIVGRIYGQLDLVEFRTRPGWKRFRGEGHGQA